MADQQTLTITPDLQTRESVMMAAGRAQFSVVREDGQTIYVKVEAKAKDLPGSDKRYTQVPLDQATHVFISEKGYGTPRLGTYYPPKPGSKYTTGRFFADLQPNHPSLEALYAIVEFVNGATDLEAWGIERIEVESKCGLCGRKLEDPESVARGIGPECAQKPTGTKILHASKFAQQEFSGLSTDDVMAMDADQLLALSAKQQGATVDVIKQESADEGERVIAYYKARLAEAEARRDEVQAQLLVAESEVANLARKCEKAEFAVREAEQEAAAALASL